MNTKSDRKPAVLLIDDEEEILASMAATIRLSGLFNPVTCSDSSLVMTMLAEKPVDLVVCDLRMPEPDGQKLLAMICAEHPQIPVIIASAIGELETAVRCMKAGAVDYLMKPVERDVLLSSLTQAMKIEFLKKENQSLSRKILKRGVDRPEAFSEIITRSPEMLALFEYAEAVAPTMQPILITGETGTGKELFARAVHAASGVKGEMVSVNVAGLDDNTFADTLFGHSRGAFTGASEPRRGLVGRAAGGSLFLDEIGDLSIASQVKLLRLLQEGEYFPLGADEVRHSDARLIVATQQNLKLLQDEGKFRKDLYFRLCTHHIHIPPLRERRSDIEPLVECFTRHNSAESGVKCPEIPSWLLTSLQGYGFPGNVRELKSLIFDSLSRCKGESFSPDIVQACLVNSGVPLRSGSDPDTVAGPDTFPTMKEQNRALVEEAMRRCNGNQTQAAKLLGITQQALSLRLKKLRD